MDAGDAIIRSVRRRLLECERLGWKPSRLILDHDSWGCLQHYFGRGVTASQPGHVVLWGLRIELSDNPEHLEVA